jgi:hypothetical protein
MGVGGCGVMCVFVSVRVSACFLIKEHDFNSALLLLQVLMVGGRDFSLLGQPMLG